jgi:hypothetical protein
MATTSNTYTGNGSNKLFSITFPYLETTDVDVYLNGTLQTITTQYTFANATTIEFVAAPANGAVVLLDRSTDDAALQATFFPGSSVKAADLNDNFDQTLYVVQEINNKAVKINDPLYANKTYIDAADALKVNKSGDTMSGALAMGTNKITGLGNPTNAQDAATKTYVDAADALKVNKAGDTMSGNLAMGGNKVTGLGAPAANADAVTKSYVDGYINTTYLGPLASDPSTRPGGATLQAGDQYFNTTQNIVKVWTGTVWVISAAAGNIVRWRKTASAGNTTLSGVDDLGVTLSYVVGNEQVYLNGALQTRGVDYTAGTGTSITLTPALLAGDVVELHAVQGYVSATITPGSINDALVAPAAGIQYSKLALSNSITSADLVDGTIVNADVNASAGITAGKLSFTQAGTGATARTVDSKLKDVVSVKDFGAVGDGVANDTAAIQAALDSAGLAAVYFPAGLYKVTGSGAACLTLTKNKLLFGDGRTSTIRADSAGANTSLLKIAITDNGGFADVRHWSIKNLYMFHNGGGKHGLHLEGGLSLATCQIDNCSISSGTSATGYGLYVYNQLAHSKISNCTLDFAYMKCFDANVIEKCTMFGTRCAITFDCETGVRNNSVLNNTIVNRDGAVWIVNGDNIRIENNQIELAQAYTPSTNQSATSAMVWIQGVVRTVYNTVIRANNFGGGTNLNHLIYIDNGQRAVIKENNLIAVNIAELYLTANAKYNVFGACNTTVSQAPSNPRTRTLFKANTVDLGEGNMGVLQASSTLNLQNGWAGSSYYKDEFGVIHFTGGFNAGTPAGGTVIGTLPLGFRPFEWRTNGVSSGAGFGLVVISSAGTITITSIASNYELYIPAFQGSTNQL